MQSWRRCSVEGTSLVFYNASTCAAALDRKYFLWKLLLALKFCSFCTALHTSNIQDQPAHVCKYMRKVRRCGEFVVDGCPQERNHWMNVNYLPSKRRQNIGALLFNGDIYRKKSIIQVNSLKRCRHNLRRSTVQVAGQPITHVLHFGCFKKKTQKIRSKMV
ncbi:uncharacterized protein LOC144112593 isoform X2 [Amblyomma americanum]